MTIRAVVQKMLKQDVNGYIVTDSRKRVVGVIALQDIAAAIIPQEFRENIGMAQAMYKHGFFHAQCEEVADKTVEEYMRRDFLSVNLNTSMMAVITDFLNNDLYIVPVVGEGGLIGVITRSEVKRALAVGMKLL